MRFTGRAGIVTGASSGIGQAIAERLAAEGANLCLVAAPGDAEALLAVGQAIETRGVHAETVSGDIGEEETARRAVKATMGRFGRVDLLASNAGIAPFNPALETPVSDFDRTYSVNVRGMFLIVAAAARQMAAGDGGAVVCTTSSDATLGYEGQVAYNVSKAGVGQMVRSLGIDLAPYGVRVNGVAPGWVRTRATAGALDDPIEWSRHRSRVALDRPAEPEEIAAVVAFLLSAEASYITGSIVACDGGLTAGLRTSDWEVIPQDPAPRKRRAPRSADDR